MAQSNSDTLIIPVSGMTCAACVHHVGEAIRTVPGVANVSINLATARATVSLDGIAVAAPPLDELARAVADAGYRLDTDATNAEAGAGRSDEERDLLRRLLVAAAGGILLLLGGFPTLPWTDGLSAAGGWWYPLLLWAVATPVQLWAGWPFYVAGFAGLRRLQPNMHTLIALGTSVAYGYSAVIVLLTLVPAFAGMTGAGAGMTESEAGMAAAGGHHLHFDMAAIIVALILLGRWLEARALSRASDAIGRLMNLRPQVAHLMSEDGSIRDVAVDRVAVGDTLAVRPGEQIPVDGEVVSGNTEVDESALTGESMPAEKSPGDAILTGALNGTGGFIMRATRVGADTTLARVIRLVEEAQGSAAPVQRLADRVSAWFVPAVGLIALAAAVIWLFLGPAPALSGAAWQYAMLTLVAVFIIACPCALGLATPTAIIVGVGKAAERGILIRSAAVLETAHRVRVVAVDKTGTLTTGRPRVTDVIAGDGADPSEVLTIAASAEQLSEHPIGRAVVERAREDGLTLAAPADFTARRGAGVTAKVEGRDVVVGNAFLIVDEKIVMDAGLFEAAGKLATAGKTPMLVARDGSMVGVIAVADGIKPETPAAVAALQSTGVRVVMLTGDRPEVAESVAAQCGITECHAGMLPADKADAVALMQSDGSVVAMAGDGINDAPALARADVGIAMGGGADIARETADITLMRDDLAGIATALKLSRETMRTIRQNLFWAFFYNSLLIPVAAGALYPVFAALGGVPGGLTFFFGDAGFLNPILAALAMAFSSVSVVSNSLRLRRARVG